MRYEKELSLIENDSKKLNTLLSEYEDIRIRLEKELSGNEKSTLYENMIELITHISDYMLQSKTRIKEGIDDIMGGKVLELRTDKWINQGLEQGLEQGMKKGRLMLLIEQVCKKLIKGKNTSIIATELDEDEQTILKICKAAEECAPEYDYEKIYKLLHDI